MKTLQNAHLTYKGNVGVPRHDWLRLTPAYSSRLVSDRLKDVDPSICILDPFAGTGTTGLVAAQRKIVGRLLDINPFLVWLAKVKTRNYNIPDLMSAKKKASDAMKLFSNCPGGEVWVPPIHGIGRWWSVDNLKALGRLKSALDVLSEHSPADDLLAVAFCRVMISRSNAAFNHQSMSFKTPSAPQLELFDAATDPLDVVRAFDLEVDSILTSASSALPGHVSVYLDDARWMQAVDDASVDLICTSPPYANRVSYIRELRPYMYWLRFLANAKQAGELDWAAIGGTWGSATSKLVTWKGTDHIPLSEEYQRVVHEIAARTAPNAKLLSKYVAKYFCDMYEHLRSAFRVIVPGGRATYVVGNSTFYGTLVPTEKWYAELLEAVGFEAVSIRTLRKRNSNTRLFEFEVSGTHP